MKFNLKIDNMERVCEEVLVRMCGEDYDRFYMVMLNWFSDGLGYVGKLRKPIFDTFLYNIGLMFCWFEWKNIPCVLYGFRVVNILKLLFYNLAYYARGFKVDDCERFWGYVCGKVSEFHNREDLTTWELSALISGEIIGIAVGDDERIVFEKNIEPIKRV